jgi:hypothetical protein
MSKQQENKTYKEDGIRPIEQGQVEIADTFQEDGNRPIEHSPDFLIPERKKLPNKVLNNEADEEPSVDKSYTEVADYFEDDGERPIMTNKYHVVDTINIDGQRPITSNN